MTEASNDTQTKDVSSSSDHDTPSRKSQGRGKCKLILLLILILFAVSFLQIYQIQTVLADREQQHTAQATQLDDRIASLEVKLTEQLDTLSAQQSKLALRVKQLNQSTLERQSDWLLLEADYLVRTASLKLQIERAPHTAIHLMETADQRLTQMGDPSINPVRQALRHDIQALKALPDTDISSVLLTLNTLSDTVTTLPLINDLNNLKQDSQAATQARKSEQEAAPNTDSATFSWLQALKASGQEIRQLIRIRRHDQPIEPLLTAKEQQSFVYNMQLKVQIAQLAVLRHNDALFRDSIATLIKWTKQYFSVSAPQTVSFLQTLEDINKPLLPAMPSLQHSLNSLSQAIKARINAPYQNIDRNNNSPLSRSSHSGVVL